MSASKLWKNHSRSPLAQRAVRGWVGGITVKLIAENDSTEKDEAMMKRLKQLMITENYRKPDAGTNLAR